MMQSNDDVQARIAAHVHREPGLTLIEISSRIGLPAWGPTSARWTRW